jgi:hypothetical protein
MDIQSVGRAMRDINGLFSPYLLETNYFLGDGVLSWNNYVPGILNGLAYAAEYQKLIDRRQYSFLLVDKSFFQFYFRFDQGELKSARLAYYPPPLKITGAMQDLIDVAEMSGLDLLEELYYGAESWLERGIDVVNTSHMRLDYDSKTDAHAQSHFQFGGLNSLRVPCQGIVSPFTFFEWICINNSLNEFEIRKVGEGDGAATYHRRKRFESGGVDLQYPFVSLGGHEAR